MSNLDIPNVYLSVDLNNVPSSVSYTPSVSITSATGTNNGPYTIYQIEKQVVTNTNAYYTLYSTALRCSFKTPCGQQIPGITCSNGNSLSGWETELTNTYNRALNTMNIFTSAQTLLNTNGQFGSIAPNNDVYDASYSNITSNYNNLLHMRSELDLKMKEIKQTNDSVYSMYKNSLDSTVYAGILWTVLATSLLYYVFIEL